MNWYTIKKYSSFDWGDVLKYFPIGILLGVSIILSVDGLPGLKEKFNQDPQSVINIIEQQSDSNLPQDNLNLPQKEQNTNSIFSNNEYLEKTKNTIIQHEGKRNKVYLDTKNIPTIGIGFNLTRDDAKSKIESLGLNFSDILLGKELLADDQMMYLFEEDFDRIVKIAKSFLYNFDEHPDEIKFVIIDMAYNLENNLFGFTDLREALANKDYNTAYRKAVYHSKKTGHEVHIETAHVLRIKNGKSIK